MTPETTPTFDEHLAQLRDELSAIPPEEVLTPRVDVVRAAMVAITCMKGVERFRGELVARFGDRATVALDRVVPTAQALIAAQAETHATSTPDFEAMAAALRARRDRLAMHADVLVERGLVARKTLSKRIGGTGYPALVHDTLLLVHWFQRYERAIASCSKVSAAELALHACAARTFAAELAARDFGGVDVGDQRARAFTLFFRAYETVANMMAFVRWREGDADEIVRTLHPRRRPRRERAPSAPAAVDAAPDAAPVAPGMPGASPFLPE